MNNHLNFIVPRIILCIVSAGLLCNATDFNNGAPIPIAFDNPGSLKLTITRESSNAQYAAIKGSLDPIIASTPSIDFDLTGGLDTYENTSIPQGYYILTIKLINNGIEGGGAVDLIKIIPNNTSETLIHIMEPPGNKGTNLVIVPLMKDENRIVLKKTPDPIIQDENYVITAKIETATDVIYLWFIDGVLKSTGPNFDSLMIPADLFTGYHRADVVIFTLDGLRGGSASYTFEGKAPI